MEKILDMTKSVAALVDEYPEVRDILKELGFTEITNPIALKLMGKSMTIPRGAAVKNIPMEQVAAAFRERGYELRGLAGEMEEAKKSKDQADELKGFLQRLGSGEDLESVRADFAKEFSTVSVHDIVKAEQNLIQEGTPATDVQKLCDLHSALFHGRTEAEIWKEEEQAAAQKKVKAAAESALEEGHPVTTLRAENTALIELLDRIDAELAAGDGAAVQQDLAKLTKIRTLYSRKEQLILPRLSQLGVTGPSDVMWGVDDEIKKDVSALAENVTADNLQEMAGDVTALTKRMREMVYKEENILFPLALEKFSDTDWARIYQDLPEMGTSFVAAYPVWPRGEELLAAYRKEQEKKQSDLPADGLLHFGESTGVLTLAQLSAILDLLPIDITFVDKDDINRFFTNKGRVFSRPASALNRPVYLCHPAAIRPIVKSLLDDFRAGKKDSFEIWTPNKKTPTRVQYLAVRDKDGNYLGAVELVERFPEDAGKHFKA
ncbi:MAG: DUF438 domain-containing protein [Firmicutes bacterium]|nr:DUF438 domain-containing protein [Bacillota bacterium]